MQGVERVDIEDVWKVIRCADVGDPAYRERWLARRRRQSSEVVRFLAIQGGVRERGRGMIVIDKRTEYSAGYRP